jgi:hypothetical protein
MMCFLLDGWCPKNQCVLSLYHILSPTRSRHDDRSEIVLRKVVEGRPSCLLCLGIECNAPATDDIRRVGTKAPITREHKLVSTDLEGLVERYLLAVRLLMIRPDRIVADAVVDD